MDTLQIFLLIALSAIWGGSFMFMRYLAPLLGPFMTADMRIFIAGGFLVLLFAILGFRLDWKANWKRFLIIGLVNSGIPFLLYSFAALYLPASVEAIFNSTAPMFGAVFSSIWLGETLGMKKIIGLVLGIGGVLIVSSLGPVPFSSMALLSMLACLLATVCYGLAGVYIKKRATDIKSKAIAAGSQLSAGIILFPLVVAFPPTTAASLPTVAVLVVFALLCSALAYLIYYKLLAEIGPTKALTVTFLIPVFGMLWGFLFLNEAISLPMLGGAAIILTGTWLITSRNEKAK
jgi:drug/metabolite transporter (DMT)-like permease